MPDLPAGTVTLLFTDIEGSTRLLQQLGARYQAVIADHHRLLRAVIDVGGQVVEDRGDGLFAVFARALDGVVAAVTAQRALAAHSWPEDGIVRVRIGLHTGDPVLVGANYVGLDVHRAARLCDAGHGGQVLLSAATRELVEHQLPGGVHLRDLGEHRLRDIVRPEHVFQAVIDGLPDAFPPLRTAGRTPNNLPAARTSIVGRHAEVSRAAELLLREDVGLVTLTGPGGSGKTRLGLQVAATLLDQFEDGVYLVLLAPVRDPALVPASIASALGLRVTTDRPTLDVVKEYLHERRALLVLDNFEQLLDAAPVVADLLTACPRLKALVTSRALLHLRGERELPVLPLALPPPDEALGAERLQQYAAVALFAERAREARPDFEITTENAPAVAEICQRLDGLPLAIELAAARARLLSPQAMLGRLGRRLPFLTGGARDLPAHQQTLRDTIGWSYDLLTPDEQRLFQRLGVFVGGCTLEAAEAVCDATLDDIASLVDKSLVRQANGPGDEPRFTMLETIREYALEQLEASGEADEVRRRHTTYFTELAEQAEPEIRRATDSRWFDRLEADHANLRAALAWCDVTDEARPLLPRLAAGLWMFWWQRGHWAEGRRWQERALEVPTEPVTRAGVLNGRGQLAVQGGELTRAMELYAEIEVLGRGANDLAMVALGVCRQSYAASLMGDAERAEALADQGYALALQSGDKARLAAALNAIGRAALTRGDYERARQATEECIRLSRQAGLTYLTQYQLTTLAGILRDQGDLVRSATVGEESLELFRRRDDRWGMQSSLGQLAAVARAQGDRDRVIALARERLTIVLTIGSRPPIASILDDLAWVAVVDGRRDGAARLFGASDAIRGTIGTRMIAARQRDRDAELVSLRAALGEEAFAAAWEKGRAMSTEQAVRYALDEIDVGSGRSPA